MTLVGKFLLGFVLLHTVVEQLMVHFHHEFQSVVDEAMNSLVPMSLGAIKRRKHDGQDDANVLIDKRQYVVIVPEVKCTFSHLEVRTGHALSQLAEENSSSFLELERLNSFENLLQLAQEHDLFGRVHFGPEFNKAQNDRLRKRLVLFQELHNAIGQLGMIHAKRLDFVQRNEHTQQEKFVLLFQGQRKAVDDGAQDFQQFGYSIVSLCFVDEATSKRETLQLASSSTNTHKVKVNDLSLVAKASTKRTLRGHEIVKPANKRAHDNANFRTQHARKRKVISAAS